jgi:two-component system response regulator YesN
MYDVRMLMKDMDEFENFSIWLEEEFALQCNMYSVNEQLENAHIVIIEVRTIFDWIKIYRTQKKNPCCRVIPLLDEALLKTSPFAMELKLQCMLIKPVTKKIFIRSMKRIMETLETRGEGALDYGQVQRGN